MARPPVTTLTRHRIGKTHLEIEITLGEGCYVVVYQDKPINIIKHHYYDSDKKKYLRNGFPQLGHARNLARKLNALFNTEDFTVKKLL